MSKRPDARRKVMAKRSNPEGKTARGRDKAENKAKSKAEKDLIEAQETLAAAQVKIKRERRARILVEKTQATTQKTLAYSNDNIEQKPRARDFFVVRLEFDKPSQPGWTEIEHGPSGTKRKFRDLDGEGLVAFIKECIGPATIPEGALSRVPLADREVVPTSESLRLTSALIVSDVRVARLASPEVIALILNSGETFLVQICFYLQGPDAPSLTAQEPLYEVKVYAYGVTSGTSQLLTTYNAHLIKEVVDYTTQIQVKSLSPGLYRLFTLVIFRAPVNMAGFYDGPIIHMI